MFYTLINCATGNIITTNADLSDQESLVVTLVGYVGCWEVKESDPTVSVEIDEVLASCKACLPNCFKTDCK